MSATESEEKRESLKKVGGSKGEGEKRDGDRGWGCPRGQLCKDSWDVYPKKGYLGGTNVGKQAHNMAIRVIEQGLCNVPEYYGTECTFIPGGFGAKLI
ncbi:MAG: hypothetical protein CM15mV131_420 [uncultured marine virus]|nr:MAG: hypothetical protein CM15mV131_420 [uncultured marine virus]